MPVMKGMKIKTNSPVTKKARWDSALSVSMHVLCYAPHCCNWLPAVWDSLGDDIVLSLFRI